MSSGVDNVLFPVDILSNAEGGAAFHTTVVTSGSGFEQRNADQPSARMRWNVGHIIDSQATMATLVAFFRARQGKARGFRFRDWSDFIVGGTIDDALVFTPGAPVQFAIGDGVTTVFQLQTFYTDAINTVARKITRPVLGTLSIYIAGVFQGSGFSIDYSTGLVTFTAAPGAGQGIQWAGLFDVPVRFDTDEMKMTMYYIGRGEWPGLSIVEVLE